jgi:hypothetical protein
MNNANKEVKVNIITIIHNKTIAPLENISSDSFKSNFTALSLNLSITLLNGDATAAAATAAVTAGAGGAGGAGGGKATLHFLSAKISRVKTAKPVYIKIIINNKGMPNNNFILNS